MSTTAPTRAAAPAVVAVVVTHDPGPWFETAVEALAAQDYPNLAILFIDAGSAVDPTPRLAGMLPDAFVRRLDGPTGYGAAANEASSIVDGAAFYCFLHDDAAPEPHAISTLVNEAVRSNAGIVGSKLVQMDDHRRLLQVGESADKTGERARRVEPGELDQEQYDMVEDVFVVPSGCFLIRTDLFDAIGGFDDGIDLLNDDLNLCWRAHVAGARVVVAPDAVVGHAEALGERSDVAARRHRLVRHRVRTMLTCYSGWHLVRVVPQAMAMAVLEVVYSLLVGRPGQAGDVAGAWRWNWQRRGEIRAMRARVAASRGVSDAEVRRFQIRGSARVAAFVRGQTTRGGTRSARLLARWQAFRAEVRSGALTIPLATWAITVLILLVGSRHLLTRGIAVVGGLPEFDLGPSDLASSYLSGWRTAGLGSASPAPTGLGMLSGLGVLTLGNMGLARALVLLGSIVVGIVGAYRLLRPAASPNAQAVALLVYAATPVGLGALASARWGALLAYGATPWVLAHLARAGGWAPFGDMDGERGPGIRSDQPIARVAALALLLAVVGAVEPAIGLVAVVLAAGLALGSVLAGVAVGVGRVLVTATGALAAAIALHVPWAIDFVLPGATWDLVVGPDRPDRTASLAELARFEVGPIGGGPLAAGLALAAVLPLLIGREWRFTWGVRVWTAGVLLLALAWADGRDWLPVHGPPSEVVLAPVAICLAMAVGLGVVAFEQDLRAYGFGWRQIASAAAGVAVLVGALPTLADVPNGRWYLPSGGLTTTFAFMDADEPGFRVLWLGDPDVLPLPGIDLDVDGADGAVFALSENGLPSITDAWPVTPGGPEELVRDSIQLAADGQTSRLGQLLAPMAIRYIVVPSSSAPEPLGGIQRPRPALVTDTLADQLDLAAVPVNPAYLVYRNEAALSARSSLAPLAGSAVTFGVTAEDLVGATPVLQERTGPTSWRGTVPAGSRLLHSVASSPGWTLVVGGVPADAVKLFGFAQGFEPATGGEAVLRYDTSPLRYGVLAFQALFWFVAIRIAMGVRRRRPVVAPGPALVVPEPSQLVAEPRFAPEPVVAAAPEPATTRLGGTAPRWSAEPIMDAESTVDASLADVVEHDEPADASVETSDDVASSDDVAERPSEPESAPSDPTVALEADWTDDAAAEHVDDDDEDRG